MNKAWKKRKYEPAKFKEARRAYKMALRESKNKAWQDYCGKIDNVSQTARLQKTLAKDPGTTARVMRRQDGSYTSNSEETLSGLFDSHFPGCKNTQEKWQQPLNESNEEDWKFARALINRDSVTWAVEGFAPYKSAGPDRIFPALLQKGLGILNDSITNILVASLALGYIPEAWREVRVVFIPKPGKESYEEFKSFRPISLTSVLLKTQEKLLDNYLRSKQFKDRPFNVNQHAYQRGRSAETAIHRLLGPVEESVERGESALGAFLDIEGAFDNSAYDLIEKVLRERGVNRLVRVWVSHMLRSRILFSNLNDVRVFRIPVGGCPQGGVLSPLLWNIIVDTLLDGLCEQGFQSIGFADDIVILVRGKFPRTLYGRMQSGLRMVENWCRDKGLSVNPKKTSLILFTRKRKLESISRLTLFGTELIETNEVKYLGIVLDKKLTWKPHLEDRLKKSYRIFGQCRRAVGKTWGLRPRWIRWIYLRVVVPYFLYGSLFWVIRTNLATVRIQLAHLQRMACLSMTGAMGSTPTAALEIILNLTPLHICAEVQARKTALRLNVTKQWNNRYENGGHSKLWKKMTENEKRFLSPCDRISKVPLLCRGIKICYPSEEEWDQKTVIRQKDIAIFTDGSVGARGAGSALFAPGNEWEASLSLGSDVNVFQAEVIAISMAAQYCLLMNCRNKDIKICSDSRAVLDALRKGTFVSRLILECWDALRRVSVFNRVSLLWVPGHSGIEGNERADGLAREASRVGLVGPWPGVPITFQFLTGLIDEWATLEHSNMWSNPGLCGESKNFLTFPKGSAFLGFSKKELNILCGILTGHCRMNKHMTRIGLSNYSLCDACLEEDETPFHVIAECLGLQSLRRKIFGKNVLSKEDTRTVSPRLILMFIKAWVSGREEL
jgi:ribonuclease HI